MDEKMKMNKKAQVTIFIIIAVLIVVAILLFFLVMRQKNVQIQQQLNPNNYIEQCTKDAVEQAVNIMLPQGGYLAPQNYKLYEDKQVAYLCYTELFYRSCVSQEPVYLEHLETEITTYIQPKIEECFYSLQLELEKRNYDVETGAGVIETEIVPNYIKVVISKKFDTSKNEEVRSYDKFKVRKISPLFDLARVAIEISSQEAKYCNFEYLGYMIFYPRFEIEKKAVGQGATASKIYTIMDRQTLRKLYIAIRSCVMPPGW